MGEPSRASRRRRVVRRAQLRGGLILAAAVILGIVLLAQGDDFVDVSTAEVSAGQAPDTTTTTTAPPATPTTPTTGSGGPTSSTSTPSSEPAEPDPPSEVRIIVLNGTTRAGVAQTSTDTLAEAGYPPTEPGNTAPRPDTVVYFAEGFDDEAQAVRVNLGAPAEAAPMPEEIRDGEGANVADADFDIVVILGQNLPEG